MKVYVMYSADGSYDDYREYVEGVYLNKDNCQKAVDKYNQELKHEREMCDLAYNTYYDLVNELDLKTDDWGNLTDEDEKLIESKMGELYDYFSEYYYSLDNHEAWLCEYDVVDA